ncbi:MAG: hypothetical protein K2J84_08190 [Bacteroidaceae bacterium]|nr:hypothetical protein [Bacteroidaceae bacterium]
MNRILKEFLIVLNNAGDRRQTAVLSKHQALTSCRQPSPLLTEDKGTEIFCIADDFRLFFDVRRQNTQRKAFQTRLTLPFAIFMMKVSSIQRKDTSACRAVSQPLNRSPRLRPTDVPDSDWSESGTSILGL